jgi:hypothetical protein
MSRAASSFIRASQLLVLAGTVWFDPAGSRLTSITLMPSQQDERASGLGLDIGAKLPTTGKGMASMYCSARPCSTLWQAPCLTVLID